MAGCRRALGGAALESGLRHNSRSRRGRLIGRAAEIKARPVLRPRLWIAGGGFRIGTFRLLVLIIHHGNLLWGFVLAIRLIAVIPPQAIGRFTSSAAR